MLVIGAGVLDWLMASNSGSTMKVVDLGGVTYDRERTCDTGRADGSGCGGNSGETSSSKDKVV